MLRVITWILRYTALITWIALAAVWLGWLIAVTYMHQ